MTLEPTYNPEVFAKREVSLKKITDSVGDILKEYSEIERRKVAPMYEKLTWAIECSVRQRWHVSWVNFDLATDEQISPNISLFLSKLVVGNKRRLNDVPGYSCCVTQPTRIEGLCSVDFQKPNGLTLNKLHYRKILGEHFWPTGYQPPISI